MVASASLSIQQKFNQATKGRWNQYAAHRAHVCRLVAESIDSGAGPASRLCVLGAGNCNDLDLVELVESFESIALLDIDTEAVLAGLERQGVARTAKITVVHADLLSPLPPLPSYDVVLSSCVLSQLIGEGLRRGASPDALLALRRKHCTDAKDITGPQGTFVLVTDFVADVTVPELMQLPDYRLGELAQRLARDGNFFHCLNPFAVETLLTADPVFRDSGGLNGRRRLWRWDIGEAAYLVAAWRWQRRTNAGETVAPLEGC